MRIASLVPAATEIACALGATGELVAVTHDCDHPAAVRTLPRLTRSTIAPGSRSAAIDAQVRRAAASGEGTFHLDPDTLREARPDVLLGQTLCDVCAVTLSQLPSALESAPEVVPLDASTIEGIFADIERVADALARHDDGRRLVASLRARLARVEERVAGRAPPRVVCLEWIEPPFNAGHWVPEQVRLAGGLDALGTAGARSREVSWSEIAEAAPDVLFVMPCGFDALRASDEAADLKRRPEWPTLPAVRAGRAYALDGNAYFSRPGPRVVDGAELLASLMHPGMVAPPEGARVIPLG